MTFFCCEIPKFIGHGKLPILHSVAINHTLPPHSQYRWCSKTGKISNIVYAPINSRKSQTIQKKFLHSAGSIRSKKKFKQKTHKQHTFLFRVLCTAVFSFLKHPVKGDDREEIFYTFASENNKITIIKKCTMCSFFLTFFGRSLRRQMEIRVVKNLSSSMCVCVLWRFNLGKQVDNYVNVVHFIVLYW